MNIGKDTELIYYEKAPPIEELIKVCTVCGDDFCEYRSRSEEQDDIEHSRCVCGYCRYIEPLGIISETGEHGPLSAEEVTFLKNWAARYAELASLLTDVIDSRDQVKEDQEIRYRGLRFWFMDNQEALADLWHAYFGRYGGVSSVYIPSERDTEEDIKRHFKHPFLYLYEPESLCKLADKMKLANGKGEHDLEAVNVVKSDLSIMGDLLERLKKWDMV